MATKRFNVNQEGHTAGKGTRQKDTAPSPLNLTPHKNRDSGELDIGYNMMKVAGNLVK